MAREAMIEINCINENRDIFFLIDLLCDGGWTLRNEKGNIEYLSVGDDEDFNWQEDDISQEEFREIMASKQQKGELVGINLFFKDSPYGVTLLARNLESVIFSIEINRKTIGEDSDSLTDFQWYFTRIIQLLNKDKSLMFSYRFEEYID